MTLSKVNSEELLINNSNYENIKKKSIKINFIEENKTENIYNITLNTNNVDEAFNRFHVSFNYDQNFKYKNYIIRQKYGKKHNINDKIKIKDRNNKLKNKKDLNKNPLINKNYEEDHKSQYNKIELNHCFSQDNIIQNKKDNKIKVNKKNNSGNRLIKINSSQKNIDEILDFEDKINKEINIHLNIINGVDIIDGFINNCRKKIKKDIFLIFCDTYNQLRINNDKTILTNLSQFSDIKYVKKIVQKNKEFNTLKNYSKKITRNKSFNAERQKILLIQKKEFGFFEKYEHCLDFIKTLRLLLIKFSSK